MSKPDEAPPDVATELSLKHADVVVVGGGRAGLAAARSLADHGHDVVVLEARGVARAVAARELGVVWPWPIEAPVRLAAALGPERAQTLLQLSLDQVRHHHQRGHQPQRVVVRPSLGGEPEELQQSLEFLEALGAQGGLLEQDALGAGPTQACGPGIWLEAALTDPAVLTRELAQGARDAGVRIYEGIRVNACDQGSDGVTVRWDRGAIEAQVVVLTCGVGGAALHPFLSKWTLAQRRTSVGFQPTEGVVASDWPTLGVSSRGYLAWRILDDALLIDGGAWAETEFGFGEHDDTRASEEVLQTLLRLGEGSGGEEGTAEDNRAPSMTATRWWSRAVCHSRDGLPLVGPIPGTPRIFTITGFAGDGALLAEPLAHEAAKRIAGAPGDASLDFLSTRRFL